jgi:hypothetical protein
VPKSARSITVKFPFALADRFNSNPDVAGSIDSSREIPLSHYVAQVRKIAETARFSEARLRHYNALLPNLIKLLNAKDFSSFFQLFAESSDFLWPRIKGRVNRGEEPPIIPKDVADPATVKALPGVRIYRDADGDLVVDLQHSVRRVPLSWFDKEDSQERLKVLERAASALARDIAEFNAENLRPLLESISYEVDAACGAVAQMRQQILDEEKQYGFLATTVLIRNRGQRTFCIGADARLFINCDGYSHREHDVTSTLSGNLTVEMVAVLTKNEAGCIEILPGTGRTVEFVSTRPQCRLPNASLIEKLGSAGERSAYLGVRMYREDPKANCLYSRPALFRIEGPVTSIPEMKNR